MLTGSLFHELLNNTAWILNPVLTDVSKPFGFKLVWLKEKSSLIKLVFYTYLRQWWLCAGTCSRQNWKRYWVGLVGEHWTCPFLCKMVLQGRPPLLQRRTRTRSTCNKQYSLMENTNYVIRVEVLWSSGYVTGLSITRSAVQVPPRH